jgi:hypothetical protein
MMMMSFIAWNSVPYGYVHDKELSWSCWKESVVSSVCNKYESCMSFLRTLEKVGGSVIWFCQG